MEISFKSLEYMLINNPIHAFLLLGVAVLVNTTVGIYAC